MQLLSVMLFEKVTLGNLLTCTDFILSPAYKIIEYKRQLLLLPSRKRLTLTKNWLLCIFSKKPLAVKG